MKLLYYASVDFYTKPNPSFHLMCSLLQDLLDNGVEICYVGCEQEGLEEHIPEFLLYYNHFQYNLVPINNISKSNFIRRYIEGIKYALKSRRYIKKYMDKCDVVFVQSSPTVLYNILLISHYKRKQRIVYNVQDMFPGSSIASGIMPQKWMQKIFYTLQKIAYRKSDIVVGISEDMRRKLIEQNVPKEKTKVIVNWFDDNTVREVDWDENRFVKKYNMKKDIFYVQYAGTMGYVFDYKMVINVAKRLEKYKDIVFQMIGEGSQKEAFIKEVQKRNIKNIVFLPLEPQEMVADVYSACSICLIPLKEGIIGNSVPSKAGLLMACKRAIVTSADENSEYNRMINENGIGIASSTKRPDLVTKAIIKMKNDAEFRRTCGEKGYKYGSVLYSRSENTKKYLTLFSSLVKKKNNKD